MAISAVDHLSINDKEKLLKSFLKNDFVIKKLQDVMNSQFGIKVYPKPTRNLLEFPSSTTSKVNDKVKRNKRFMSTPKKDSHVQLSMTKIVFQGKKLVKKNQ